MTWTDIFGRILSQITSGRWIITIAAVYCLTMLTQTLCNLMESGRVTLETATYVAIAMSILNTIGTITIFYFQKPRDIPSADNTNGDIVETETTTTTTLGK